MAKNARKVVRVLFQTCRPVDLIAGGAAGRHAHGGVSGKGGQLLERATTPSCRR